MKKTVALALLALPLLARAGDYPHGLSDTMIEEKPRSQLEQELDRQRASGPPEQGEMSAQVYVDTQKRISETFRRPVPDNLSDLNSRGE
ncbi:hypothetical protein [Marinobacter mobilis]|uniref:DUF3613 domain-containing protein n=1 Tax=Marinobacter mobilis TaxID=488533 RepID=A0A1H2Y1Z8_9GAMM|nr:hypothetical protein [Marinobacter mobilis]SDW99223.1 hypothetical protein SAMN04487960_105238 [Marinobacter mobilis]